MLRLPIFILTALFMSVVAAQAQAPQPAASEPGKPLINNERLRVSEMRWKPGAKIGLPNHPDQFAYLLTDATLVFSTPGKTPYQLDLKAGEATLLPAQSTEAANDSDREVRALLVEIKPSGGSANAAASRDRGKSKDKAKGKTANKIAAGPKSKGANSGKSKNSRKGHS
jgi:hypothetical protein